MGGRDTIAGGAGADELRGQDDDDVITGSGLSDLVFGGDGDDFVNGGFGFDRVNGGTGADSFYHLGIADHGSDWVQDYAAAEGDVLLFGGDGASAGDFNLQFTHSAGTGGDRSGDDDIEEAFVVYRPAGVVLWALVDGGDEDEINISIGGEVFDLLS
ncbi:calcium-binding protein [Rhodovulum iodosum]|nr:calcium-binding protein [Rhodovulum robiginosum]